LTLLEKTLLQLEEIGKRLSPNFNTNVSVCRNVRRNHGDPDAQRSHAGPFICLINGDEGFVGGLPERVNKILDAVGILNWR